jgi:hypothetical protein
MPVTALVIVSFFLSALSSAQEVRRINLPDVGESRDYRAVRSGKYMICDTQQARTARKAVRVSVESLTPTDIDPREQISVVFRVENCGQVSVILPVSPRITDLQPENDSDHYNAMLPLGAGTPGGAIYTGWLELYGSMKSNTTVSLKPGEWITVRGDIRVHNWYAAGTSADASSDLQLYRWLPNQSDGLEEPCIKQVPGASIRVRFRSPKQSP